MTTQPKPVVTLEDVALELDAAADIKSSDCHYALAAALVRAADRVVQAVRKVPLSHTDWCMGLYNGPEGCTCGITPLLEALADFDRARGTSSGVTESGASPTPTGQTPTR